MLEYLVGWRSVFFIMAAIGAVLAVVNFKTWRSIHQNHLSRNPIQRKLFRILGSVSVTTIWAISMYALYVYIGAALYSENKFSSSEIALAVTFYGVGAVLGSLISGHLTSKFGENIVSKVTLIILTVTLIAIGIFFSSGEWVYFFLFIWALVEYAGFTSYQARLAAEYPEERGIVMAWNNTALYIGITLGSMIGGYIITNWGYSMLPFGCAGLAALSLILSTQKVKEEKAKEVSG
ncbi:putative MFS family arabinose efflux permease [Salirhabdus euzebyi]|uniref:Putative MFS family arabinose efflux permease n=1 Tax=Salirhabdus euzebyi TaxID=394506 RepID=A0A841Q2V6_9BACI|nr:MFS transporter [Salirhabdus euzebyi]MBB6451638.1 putative MFS family arabinose efflux permease [Salirhabdus euzebyi]